MTQEELRQYLIARVAEAPSMTSWANIHGVSKQLVSEMCSGRAPVTGKVLVAMGFKRVVVETFVPVDQDVEIPQGFSIVGVSDTGRILDRYRGHQ